MECLLCGHQLDMDSSDDRVEWYSEQYRCPECGTPHERMQVYQPQSRLVKSDELYCLNKQGYQIKPEQVETCRNCNWESVCEVTGDLVHWCEAFAYREN